MVHSSSANHAKAVVQSGHELSGEDVLCFRCLCAKTCASMSFSRRLVKFRRSSCPISARSGSVHSCTRISSQQAVGGIDALLDGLISVFRCRKNSCHPPRQDSVGRANHGQLPGRLYVFCLSSAWFAAHSLSADLEGFRVEAYLSWLEDPAPRQGYTLVLIMCSIFFHRINKKPRRIHQYLTFFLLAGSSKNTKIHSVTDCERRRVRSVVFADWTRFRRAITRSDPLRDLRSGCQTESVSSVQFATFELRKTFCLSVVCVRLLGRREEVCLVHIWVAFSFTSCECEELFSKRSVPLSCLKRVRAVR